MKINMIPLVLLDAEISLCHLIGRVVVEIHQHGWLCALLPGMIPKSFSERVAADMSFKACVLCGFLNNTIGLKARERGAFRFLALKKIVCLCGRPAYFIILFQRLLFVLIDCNNSFFSCFLFRNTDVSAKFPLLFRPMTIIV